VSVNDGYLEPARGRNNLAIFGEAAVDRLLFDREGEGARAVGVRVLIGSAWREIRGGTVILSAGAVHSPAILMRSGLGPAAHLAELGIGVRADLPVGEAFQDHPACFLPVKLADWAMPPADFRHTNCCVRYSSRLVGAGPNDMMMVAMNRMGRAAARRGAADAGRGAARELRRDRRGGGRISGRRNGRGDGRLHRAGLRGYAARDVDMPDGRGGRSGERRGPGVQGDRV
jgi:choline dehydrogenase